MNNNMQPTVKDSTLFLGRSAELEAKIQRYSNAQNYFTVSQNQIFNVVNKVNDFNSLKMDLVEAILKTEDLGKRLYYKKKNKAQLAKLNPVSEKNMLKVVQVLGYNIIKEEAKYTLVSDFLDLANKTKDRDLKKLIKNAAWLGAISLGIAEMLDYPDTSQAFFAGLNYHLDSILIGLNDLRTFQEIEKMKNKGMDEHSISEAILGIPRSEVTKRFLLTNKIPEPVIDTVCNGKEHKHRPENDRLVAIVQYADRIVKSINNDKKSIADIWLESHNHLKDLDWKISFTDWSREVKLLFFKLIKLENEV